jgi:hypothetical protein
MITSRHDRDGAARKARHGDGRETVAETPIADLTVKIGAPAFDGAGAGPRACVKKVETTSINVGSGQSYLSI